MGDTRRRRLVGSDRGSGLGKGRRALRVGALVAGLALLVAAPALAAIHADTTYVFANAPAKDWKTSNQSIVITASGVEATPTIHYSLDGGATTYTAETVTATPDGDATFTVDVATEGSHEFKYWISQEDTSSVVATRSPGYVNIDKSAPVTTATAGGQPLALSATSRWWDDGVTVTMVATDTLSGVAANYPTYRVNDGNLSIYEFPFAIEKQGSTKITYQAVDKAGNVERTVTGYVNIDEMAPSLDVRPVPNRSTGWYSTDVTVNLIATDTVSGVERLEYRESTSATWTPTTGAFLLTSPANAGQHKYECRAIDGAGNIAQHDVTVNIDKVGPTTSVKATSGRVYRAMKLKFMASDPYCPYVKKVAVKVRDARGKIVKTFYMGDRLAVKRWYSVTWRPSRAGAYTYSVYAQDLAGNNQVKRNIAKIIVRR